MLCVKYYIANHVYVRKISVLTIADNKYNDLHNLQQQQTNLSDGVPCILKLRTNYNQCNIVTKLVG